MPFDATELMKRLSGVGLNHTGIVDVATYNAGVSPELHTDVLAPWARSILVFASGGSALWDALLVDLRREPSHLTESDHPLDDFVHRSLAGVSDVFGGVEHRWIQASSNADIHLDFRRLAVMAGLGSPSRLGLIIHPIFGPWMGLRAACFLPIELPVSAPIEDQCGDCPAPCVEACLGDAFVDGQWEVSRCADFHRRSSQCAVDCDSRLACPVGVEFRYPKDERGYHCDRAIGRKRMAQVLNIEGDYRKGIGPHWGGWSTPQKDSSSD